MYRINYVYILFHFCCTLYHCHNVVRERSWHNDLAVNLDLFPRICIFIVDALVKLSMEILEMQ